LVCLLDLKISAVIAHHLAAGDGTRDLDQLGLGDASEQRILSIFREVLAIDADDGVAFDLDALQIGLIREELEYGGIRLRGAASLSGARRSASDDSRTVCSISARLACSASKVPVRAADPPFWAQGPLRVSLEAERTEVEQGRRQIDSNSSQETVTRSLSVARVRHQIRRCLRLRPHFPAVKQRSPGRDELEQHIVVPDIRSQHHQAKLPRLQKQHTVLERTQLRFFVVPLEAT
jgi:hypothetical protein